MFTGIIEAFGKIVAAEREGSNLHLTVASPISHELRVDQSVSHNGVCLTVVAVGPKGAGNGSHTVTAVEETLRRTNLGQLRAGSLLNLERAMRADARLDGHIVQGHVDVTGTCTSAQELDGSWAFAFEYPYQPAYLLVDKGSICVNGVSLTVVQPTVGEGNFTDLSLREGEEGGRVGRFSVAIIPYTFEHTNFKELQPGDSVNLEFDVIGKYVAQHLAAYSEDALLKGAFSAAMPLR
jgi:riboflavin synthase